MQTKSKLFLIGIALVFVFAFTACEEIEGAIGAAGPEFVADAPVILAQPALNTDGDKVTINATSPDGGTISAQWFKATAEEYAADLGEPIGSGLEYTINITTEGVWLVYVKVTNTRGESSATVKSDPVQVIINDPANAQYPVIAGPVSSGILLSETATLTVDASVTDGGTLTFQWYSVDEFSNEDGTLIVGATSATFSPSITVRGTYYYYAAVTNTNSTASGRKTSVNNSIPVFVKTANAAVAVNDTRQQYVRGFGGMAVFWGNAPQDSVADYEKMFSPTGLGLNMLRITLPVDNTAESSADMNEILQKTVTNQLTGDKDRSHYYEIVKVANKYGGYVLASPWTPPAQWKTNNSINGGGAGEKAKLKTEYYADYADYLREYCQIMYDHGAPIYAVSIQNEPNFPANYDGCEWEDVDMRNFFRLVRHFTEGVKGWGGGKEIPRVLAMNGESANSPTINDSVINDAQARQYVDLYGRHLYGSQQVTRSEEVQALGKEMWMTEHNINGGNADTYPSDSTYNYIWKFLNDVDVSIRLNKENAFIWWYLKRFYSIIGDGDYGTVDGAILPRGYALSHYAKYASETNQVGVAITGTNNGGGALIVGSNINNTSFSIDSTAARVTAFLSKDGNSLSVILWTPTNTSGGTGVNMGDVKIAFPAGFKATRVTAMRTKSDAMGKTDIDTVLINGGTGAIVNLPAGQILSVKFTK